MEATLNGAGHLTPGCHIDQLVCVSFTPSPDTTTAGFGSGGPPPGIGNGSASTWSEPKP